MKDVIKVIRERDPAVRSISEVFLYPGFWAVFYHRIAHFFYKRNKFFIARFISQIARGMTGIEIHPGAKIGKGLFIDHGMGVVVGETCEIGNNVVIYQGVTLGGTGKDTGKRHPTIGNNVLIGSGVKILGPLTIGDNARIGAGSVVLQDVAGNSTVVGVPGRTVSRKDNLEKINNMDQIRYPDPVRMELCELRQKIRGIEEKINNFKKKEGN